MKIFSYFLSVLLIFLVEGLCAQGQFRGTVVNVDGEPMIGASVLIPELKAGAYTNDKGIFSLDKLPVGTYRAVSYYFGYDTATTEIEVIDQGTTTYGFVLRERMVFTEEVTILGRQTGKIEKTQVTTGVTAISPQEIYLLPSVGDADLAQFLQVLPGVVFTGDQGGQLYIRGGTPIQNMVLLDGMIIYSPFHSIGLFSVFDPDYIRTVDVYSAAFPGQYGGRISSVIDIQSRSGSYSKFKGKVNVNPFSSGVLLEGPLSKGKNPGGGISYLISARNNYIDKTAKTLYPYINDTTGLPYNFLDLYGKLSMSDGVNYASFFGFRHTDNVNFEFPADIGWNSYGGGANFQLLPSGAGAIISGTVAYSRYQSELQNQSERFPRRSLIQGFNGSLNVGYIFNSVDEFNFGMQFLGFGTDYLFTNSFGFVTDQQASNTEATIYSRYKKVIEEKTAAGRSFERAVIEPSLHLHYYNNQSRPRIEPRLRAKLNFPGVSFSAAAGIYSQNLMAASSDRDVVNLFQGFLSAPEGLSGKIKQTSLQTAWHGLGGVEFELFPNLNTAIEGWYKSFTQLSNINRDKIFPSDPDFITETGLAYGYDLVLKYQTPGIYLYSTYGWAKVRRTDRLQSPEPREYPPVFDRRHTINFLGAYKFGRYEYLQNDGRFTRPKFTESKWEFSLRWTLGSGFPFTQTQGYFEKLDFLQNGAQSPVATQNGNLGLILSDELNGGRLPYYHRMDISAKRRWLVRNKFLLELNGSIINTYNRNNIFYFDRIQFEPVYQLPVLPSMGVTVRY